MHFDYWQGFHWNSLENQRWIQGWTCIGMDYWKSVDCKAVGESVIDCLTDSIELIKQRPFVKFGV